MRRGGYRKRTRTSSAHELRFLGRASALHPREAAEIAVISGGLPIYLELVGYVMKDEVRRFHSVFEARVDSVPFRWSGLDNIY